MLREALEAVLRQQPMLRAQVPPDDGTDLQLLNGRNGLSTTVASVWSMLGELGLFESMPLLGSAVSAAIWQCWPRTVILEDAPSFEIPVLSRCLVNLESEGTITSFLYCSVTHKYGDGGAAAALVTALGEAYDTLANGGALSSAEHPVETVNQQRLWKYLTSPGQEGQVDMYLFDIVSDMHNHAYGQSVGVDLGASVCDLLRAAALRLSCSEEIAWLSCLSCAMLRLLPDEKLLKIMLVHNGRLGDAEGAVACVSNYVMITIPCLDRYNTPLADVCSRVKHAVTHGQFRRPSPCEQAHARINIGGMIGTDGQFTQLFRSPRGGREPGWSRAPYVIQLRMDNEGGIWCVKDFKCHQMLDASSYWTSVVCAAQEIAEGCFTNPLAE
ncbi:unnamed protein product [Effrenium voratum]|nr:unnamed protein product [Effrenium voratum]